MSEPVRLSWDLRTRAGIEAAWALLSDTDAFNRVAGFGFTFTEEKQPDGTTARTGHMRRLGLHLTWEERPWRFKAPEMLRYTRRFHGGPAERLEGELRLEPIAGGGTRVRYELAIYPTGLLTRPIVMLDATMSTKPQLDAVLRKAIAALDENEPFDRPPPLSPEAEALLDARLADVAPAVAAALRDMLRTAPLPVQDRIRPGAIARRAGVDVATAAEGLLRAVRAGALTLRWQLICPSCLAPKSTLERLPSRRADVHCESCGITYDGTFPDSVEVVFRPVPALRPGPVPVDCALSPGRTPHVLAQVELAPSEVLELPATLKAGTYRVRMPSIGTPAILKITDGAPATVTADVTLRGVLPSVLEAAPGPVTLVLRSRMREATTVVVDKRWRPPDALTAGKLLQMPSARDLVPAEALAEGAIGETARRFVLAAESPREASVVKARFDRAGGRLYVGNGAWIAVWERAADAIAGAELLAVDSRASGAVSVGAVVEIGEDRIPSGPAVDAALETLRAGGGARFAFTGDAWRDGEVKEAVRAFAERVIAVAPTPAGDVKVRFPAAEKARREAVVDTRKKAGTDRFAGLYRVIGTIAEGGFGRVLEAEDPNGKRVAVKVLKPEMAEDPLAVQLFYNEGRIASSLKSPHVVRVYDYGETEADELYLTMERLDGGDLDGRIDKGPIAADVAAKVVIEALIGLEEAHAAGIVHRDLKPENVFLARHGGRDDFVKVLDFGVARRLDAADPGAERGVSLGTPLYMSPEQLENEPLDARSDVYAMGLVLYRAIAGTMPWEAPQPMGVVYKRLREPARPLVAVAPQAVPPEIATVVMRALQRDPERRYASAREMREALQSALSSPSASGGAASSGGAPSGR